jgi:hypothetical protein
LLDILWYFHMPYANIHITNIRRKRNVSTMGLCKQMVWFKIIVLKLKNYLSWITQHFKFYSFFTNWDELYYICLIIYHTNYFKFTQMWEQDFTFRHVLKLCSFYKAPLYILQVNSSCCHGKFWSRLMRTLVWFQ